MGVQGLTTYVAKNSDRYLKPCELKNCALVIDGNSLASLLYNWHAKCICAFGGDYDKYANCVRNFFIALKRCGVTPLVLFDGGYESKKLRTAKKRFGRKIGLAKHITPTSNNKFFPLLMKEVFKDVLIDLSIPFTQCLFEADDEIAAIARRLNCPVLSYDSDFYVYDVMYIPFSTMSIEVSKRYNENDQRTEFYLNCSIYHLEKFLNQFGGLDKSLIPLMATLLGNDYISRNVFKNFFRNYLKLQKKRSISNTQKYISSLLRWLKTETLKTATQKVLSTLKLEYRNRVSEKIRRTIEGYTQCDSELLPYLDLSANYAVALSESHEINTFHLCDSGNLETTSTTSALIDESSDINSSHESKLEDSEIDSSSNSSIEDVESEDDLVDSELPNISMQDATENLPHWFKDSFHRGNLPPYFMDMITRQSYYCPPQVEDYNLPFAHQISLPIISVIFGFLTVGTDRERQLLYYARNKKHQVEKLFLNPNNNMPSTGQFCFSPLNTLSQLHLEKRKAILLNTLELSDTDEKVLNGFPEEWKIGIISLLYWGRHCTQPSVSNCHVHAILLSLLTLNVVDKHIGYYRTKAAFLKALGNKLKIIKESKQNTKSGPFCNARAKKSTTHIVTDINQPISVADLLTVVMQEDCILVAETLMLFHQMNDRLKDNRKLYSHTTVHAYAQLQSCLLHIMNLNALLNFPFAQCQTAKFFSGTFIYNAYTNLKKCFDVDVFIELILRCGPSVRDVYTTLYQSVQSLLPEINVRKKRKKLRNCRSKNVAVSQTKEEMIETEYEHSQCEDDANFQDLNNKFTVLATITS